MGFLRADLIDTPDDVGAAGVPIRLAGSSCTACGRVDFPARASCSRCGGDVEAHALSSRATLGPRTAVLHAPPGGLVEVPYHVGVAEFPEGVAVLGLVISDHEVPRGTPVETVSVPVGDRLTYGFRPVTDAG